MKHSTSKFLKAILCFFALLNANLVFSQSITIHDGTDTNENVPYYFYFSDAVNTTSQFIYPASDLTELKGKNITSIKFYNAGYKKTGVPTLSFLYMKVTTLLLKDIPMTLSLLPTLLPTSQKYLMVMLLSVLRLSRMYLNSLSTNHLFIQARI